MKARSIAAGLVMAVVLGLTVFVVVKKLNTAREGGVEDGDQATEQAQGHQMNYAQEQAARGGAMPTTTGPATDAGK